MTVDRELSQQIAGVVLARPAVWADERGAFVETFRQEWLPDGAPPMVQGNRADRVAGTLVGFHYHRHQADYWYVVRGDAMVVLHDLRAGSPTEAATIVLELGPPAHVGVYVPPGVAHGFFARTDLTLTYLVDRYHDPADELGVAWDDPEIAAPWPRRAPILSERDRSNPKRVDLPTALRPRYTPPPSG